MKQVLLLTLSIIIGAQACKDVKKQQPPAARSFSVVEVVTKEIDGFYTFPTDISGKNNNPIRSKIQGYIKEVYVQDGQKVTAGQVLFRIETNVQNQNAGAAKSQIGAADAGISAAEASVSAAQVEVDKLIPLVEKDIISNIQLETAKANLLKAKGQLSQAKANKTGAQANYQSVVENIGFSVIKSPINGVIGKINARQGALVSPTDPQPIAIVSDVSLVYAYFSLTERQYLNFFEQYTGKDLEAKIANVPPISLELANGSIFDKKGKLVTATSQIDPTTGTIQFRVAFDNKSRILSNGSTGRILIPRSYGKVVVVPESATFDQQGFTYVYKVDKDTARSVVVEVTDRVNNYAIINKGLSIGDKVVSSGIGNLKSGTAIKPNMVNMDSIVSNIKPIF